MKLINKKQNNIIECDCGIVIEYDNGDIAIQQTEESKPFYAVGVKCPSCGRFHIVTAENFVPKSTVKPNLNDYSFAEIKAMVKSGNHNFSVGDTKRIKLKNGTEIDIEILGFCHDVKVNGEKTAVTFCFKHLYGEIEMNDSFTNEGGWRESKARKYYNKEFLKQLPDDLVDLITPVLKKTDNDGKIDITEDKIFFPSEVEVFGRTICSAKGEREQYEFFKDWKNRIKNHADVERGEWWWLRSPRSGSSDHFCTVYNYGFANNNYAHYSHGVAPCFAI